MDASPPLSEPADAGARDPSSDEEWQQHRRRRLSSVAARSGRSTPQAELESAPAAGRGDLATAVTRCCPSHAKANQEQRHISLAAWHSLGCRDAASQW